MIFALCTWFSLYLVMKTLIPSIITFVWERKNLSLLRSHKNNLHVVENVVDDGSDGLALSWTVLVSQTHSTVLTHYELEQNNIAHM